MIRRHPALSFAFSTFLLRCSGVMITNHADLESAFDNVYRFPLSENISRSYYPNSIIFSLILKIKDGTYYLYQ